jgi:protease PrsW
VTIATNVGAAKPAPPSWQPDPWRVAPWRWWDGVQWTGYVASAGPSGPGSTGLSAAAPKKPRMPAWLSWPVIACSVIVVPSIVLVTFLAPLAIMLGLVPLAIVLPAFAWLDRVEPEPRAAKLHALLWGATVAPLVSFIVNTTVGALTNDSIAAVVSAPVIEEGMKGLGILWAIRRLEINDRIDGIVYAGWVALGFAVSEDFLYFVNAQESGQLVGVFIVRALLTPFAHPLFTAWTGLAIGWAVAKGRSPYIHALWGLGLAIVSHAAWNGSLTWSQKRSNGTILLLAALGFVLLFAAAVTMAIIVRNRERSRFVSTAPTLAAKLGMTPAEISVFASWRGIRVTRKSLSRPKRRHFDALHASLARLTALHHREAPPLDSSATSAEEGRHVENLLAARSRLMQQ